MHWDGPRGRIQTAKCVGKRVYKRADTSRHVEPAVGMHDLARDEARSLRG